MATIDGSATIEFVVELTRVARYTALVETAYGGVTVTTDNDAGDFQGLEFPGITLTPSVIFYRTRHTGLTNFTVIVNSSTVTGYTFTESDPPERCWHEIISAGTLKAQNNELVFEVTSDDATGSVTVGDVVIMYTSDETVIKVPVTLQSEQRLGSGPS